MCWGVNSSGQLGDGTYNDRSTPTAVFGLASGVAAVAAAPYHTCAVTSGGGARCWGYNSAGQLGDGTTTDRTKPTPVSGLSSGVRVDRGRSQSFVRGDDGRRRPVLGR